MRNLETILVELSKGQLTEIRQTLEIKGVSGLNKKDLSAVLAERIPAVVPMVLELTDVVRYEALEKVVAQGGKAAIKELNIFDLHFFMRFGLLFEVKGDEPMVEMGAEVMEVFKATAKPAVERNTKLVQYMNGMLHFYGAMPFVVAHKNAQVLLGEELDLEWFVRFHYYAARYYDEYVLVGEYVVNVLVQDEEALIAEHEKHPDLGYRPFSKEMIEEAGSNGMYLESTEAFEAVKAYLQEHYEFSAEDLENYLFELFYEIQTAESPDGILQRITEQLQLSTKEEIQEVGQMVMEMIYHTSFWSLKGHKPSELRTETPKEPITVTKIGRNEPCPCGSGKKYKKCCA